MDFSGLSPSLALLLTHLRSTHTCDEESRCSASAGSPAAHQRTLWDISPLVLHVSNKCFSPPVVLFSSTTSLSRSITTTRRLWSCAQRTPKTATSGWLQSHRPGSVFTWPFTCKHNWQRPEDVCVCDRWLEDAFEFTPFSWWRWCSLPDAALQVQQHGPGNTVVSLKKHSALSQPLWIFHVSHSLEISAVFRLRSIKAL